MQSCRGRLSFSHTLLPCPTPPCPVRTLYDHTPSVGLHLPAYISRPTPPKVRFTCVRLMPYRDDEDDEEMIGSDEPDTDDDTSLGEEEEEEEAILR